jgi:hypothetical protein
MAAFAGSDSETTSSTSRVIDSHLHIWASPQEAETYPYFPGQEPTLTGDVNFLLKNMEEARVDGALIVQPINHKFDHSLVTSVLKRYPSKFVGCCLANPAEDGSGITHLENLVLEVFPFTVTQSISKYYICISFLRVLKSFFVE